MKKIIAFDTLKFILSIFIVLHHTGIILYKMENISTRVFDAAYLAVECFLVLSGFLLAKSYHKEVYQNLSEDMIISSYFIRKVKRLWPEYIIAMLVCALLMNLFIHHISMKTFLLNVIILSDVGNISTILGGTWYISNLLWGGTFYFVLLVFYKDKAKYLFIPLIAIICLFYLVNHGGNINGYSQPVDFNLLSRGIIRSLLGLAIGIFCFEICKSLENLKLDFNKRNINILLFILECIITVLLLKHILREKSGNISDFNVYFYMSFIIGILYFHKEKLLSFLSWRGWGKVSYLSYTLFLTHLILLEIVKKYWKQLSYMSPWESYSIIIFLSLVFSFVCYHLQKWIFAKLKSVLFVSKQQIIVQNISGDK